MRRKPTNRSSYTEVVNLYVATGRTDFRILNVNDIKVIHGFDIRETPGYEDMTEAQQKTFEAYVIKHMNSVGMNTRITMWPKSVHFVKEYTYCGPEEWDEDEKCNLREQIGREWVIQKANGRTKKFKKYFDEGKSICDVDEAATKVVECIRVDWKYCGSSEWFHVFEDLNYY